MCSGTTQNLKLPQYDLSDHPDFLSEINEAYRIIDSSFTGLKTKLEEIDNRLKAVEALAE